MTCREIFEDFLNVGYNPVPWGTNVRDTKLGDYIILRLDRNGLTIYYLESGSSLQISKNWLELWSNFYKHSGKQVLHNMFCNVNENSYLDCFIYHLTNLISLNGSELASAKELSRLGTEKFIKYTKDTWPLLDLGLTKWVFNRTTGSTCI